MPTYEYRCNACGQHVEAVQSFTDDPLTECGVCGGQLRKVFSPVGIVFKGSGFYRTDSRVSGGGKPKKESTAPKETSKASSGSDSSSGSSGSGSSDSSKGSSTSTKASKIA